jgi:hypothetical protein
MKNSEEEMLKTCAEKRTSPPDRPAPYQELIAQIKNDTPSIPDYWANMYFKTNFNH